jgi:hypothetical protein
MKTESMGTINKPVCDEKGHVEPWVKGKDRVDHDRWDRMDAFQQYNVKHGNCQKADNSLWADADEKRKLATDDELREWTEELAVFVYPVRT